MNAADYLETTDGAKIYYEDRGEGQPILLVHGWLCSSKFWRKNVPELANEFRVVTIDLRGHGNSSKGLTGHTIAQYARDVREVIERLGLQETVLVGWSMGGEVVLSYYEQYGRDTCLKALGLADSAPFPFSPACWNSHALRNYNYDGMNATLADCTANPRKFAMAFTTRMFKQKPSGADIDWVVAEIMKTPPWIAEALYSDFVMSDHAKSLPAVKVPVIVLAQLRRLLQRNRHGQSHRRPSGARDLHPLRECWSHSLLRRATEVRYCLDEFCQSALVCCPGNTLTKSRDLLQDRIDGK